MRYTTWHSGIHAGCVVMQVLRSQQAGLEWADNLFDYSRDDGDCDAQLLATLLNAEGIDATGVSTTRAVARTLVADADDRGKLALIQVRSRGTDPVTRWAVLRGHKGRTLVFGVAVSAAREGNWGADIGACATGEVVLIGDDLPDSLRGVIYNEA